MLCCLFTGFLFSPILFEFLPLVLFIYASHFVSRLIGFKHPPAHLLRHLHYTALVQAAHQFLDLLRYAHVFFRTTKRRRWTPSVLLGVCPKSGLPGPSCL
jgi:hypothetical protein